MQSINVKKENNKEVHKSKMSVERLKSFKGFENVSEEEADKIIKNLEQFAEILCKQVQQNVS
jgi:geranylgeranyl pyrophosphate synthase